METFKIPGLEKQTESEEELGLKFEDYDPDKVLVKKSETTVSKEKLKEMKKMSPILGHKANLFARIFNQ